MTLRWPPTVTFCVDYTRAKHIDLFVNIRYYREVIFDASVSRARNVPHDCVGLNGENGLS